MCEIETKKCSKCGELKLLSEFYKEKRVKSGLQSTCKKCYNLRCNSYKNYAKEYYQKKQT